MTEAETKIKFNDGKYTRMAVIARYTDTNEAYIELSKGLLTSNWTQYLTFDMAKTLDILRVKSEQLNDYGNSGNNEKYIEFIDKNSLDIFSKMIEDIKTISNIDDMVTYQKAVKDFVDKTFTDYYHFEEQEY